MILVVGMARSGIAAARLLGEKGYDVFVSDSGTPAAAAELKSLGIAHETGGHTAARFLDAEEIVVSPGVPLDIPPLNAARRKGVRIVSELELAARYLQGEIVAITGSNGKTTTTTLIGEVLKATGRPIQVGGNIGTAMSSLVYTSSSATINVVEVSSFQLDGIDQFRPQLAVLLNITPDHLDRYADFQAYRASKFQVFRNQRAEDTAIINRDDPQSWPPPRPLQSRVLGFSRHHETASGAWLQDDTLMVHGRPVMTVSELQLRGTHNIENTLASIVAADVYHVTVERMAEIIRGFSGVEHRIEPAGVCQGIAFFNDSKATNVDAAIKAVESFEKNIIIILGGKDKGASYAPLVQAMQGRVKHAVLLGAAAERIQAAIGTVIPTTRVDSMDSAVRTGLRIGQPGDVVLLSPACASFDMFDNYEQRGRVFKESVSKLT